MVATKKPRGKIDGGEGRGVRLGGTDSRPPTGYREVETLDDDEVVSTEDALADFDAFSDEDADAIDRRRDPLRR